MDIIYMADVVDSGKTLTPQRYEQFKDIVQSINALFAQELASPLTITLGDEFQGVVHGTDNEDAILDVLRIILEIEERLWLNKTGITLRHVVCESTIDSPINSNIAHGMIGEGFVKAREALAELKKGRKLRSRRFLIELNDSDLSRSLERCFLLFEFITNKWNHRDAELIEAFLNNEDYKEVAALLNKDTSLMWRREGWLGMREYRELKFLMEDLVLMGTTHSGCASMEN